MGVLWISAPFHYFLRLFLHAADLQKVDRWVFCLDINKQAKKENRQVSGLENVLLILTSFFSIILRNLMLAKLLAAPNVTRIPLRFESMSRLFTVPNFTPTSDTRATIITTTKSQRRPKLLTAFPPSNRKTKPCRPYLSRTLRPPQKMEASFQCNSSAAPEEGVAIAAGRCLWATTTCQPLTTWWILHQWSTGTWMSQKT